MDSQPKLSAPSARQRTVLTSLFVFGLIALVYVFDLGRTPVYFGGDEAHFAVVGHSVATTGRNLNGDVMPLFFNLADPDVGPAADAVGQYLVSAVAVLSSWRPV